MSKNIKMKDMNNFPEVFNDVKTYDQFTSPEKYKQWVIDNYSDVFQTDNKEAIVDMMLVHQILYPQIKRQSFENQLKSVLKMAFTIVRSNRIQIRGVLLGAKKDAKNILGKHAATGGFLA